MHHVELDNCGCIVDFMFGDLILEVLDGKLLVFSQFSNCRVREFRRSELKGCDDAHGSCLLLSQDETS